MVSGIRYIPYIKNMQWVEGRVTGRYDYKSLYICMKLSRDKNILKRKKLFIFISCFFFIFCLSDLLLIYYVFFFFILVYMGFAFLYISVFLQIFLLFIFSVFYLLCYAFVCLPSKEKKKGWMGREHLRGVGVKKV